MDDERGNPLNIPGRADRQGQDEARNPAYTPPVVPDAALAAAVGAAQDAQDAAQAQAEGQEAALAEPEDVQDGPAPAFTHVQSVTVGSKDRRIVHAAHHVLSGAKLDGRTWPGKTLSQRRERIAKDRGFDRFQDAPTVLQGEIEGYVRLWLAVELLWASFIATGRLPDSFVDFEQAKTRKAIHLGLERRLKDATPKFERYVEAKYGGRNGTSEHR